MKPKWQKLASLAQEICTLYFQFFGAFFASKGYPFKNIFDIFKEIKLYKSDLTFCHSVRVATYYSRLCSNINKYVLNTPSSCQLFNLISLLCSAFRFSR